MKSELVMWEDIGLLDYIGDVENIYIPCYDEFEYRDSADIIMIPIDDETPVTSPLMGFTEEEIRLADTRPVEATQCKEIFSKRYNDNHINKKNAYDTYQKELGHLVEKLELDVDKFWFLTLFTQRLPCNQINKMGGAEKHG